MLVFQLVRSSVYILCPVLYWICAEEQFSSGQSNRVIIGLNTTVQFIQRAFYEFNPLLLLRTREKEISLILFDFFIRSNLT